MKTFLKVTAVVGLLVILVIGGFMGTISFLHAMSRRQITQLVSEIRPGMSFSDVSSRLGGESQTLTNVVDIENYGTSTDLRFLTNCTLHLFVHGNIPSRWICIYTDRESQAVIYASWRDM